MLVVSRLVSTYLPHAQLISTTGHRKLVRRNRYSSVQASPLLFVKGGRPMLAERHEAVRQAALYRYSSMPRRLHREGFSGTVASRLPDINLLQNYS